MKKPTKFPEFLVSMIERHFTLASIGTSPPVGHPPSSGGYYIRVLGGETRHRDGSITTKYDYFHLDENGLILSAPRGYTKSWKPGRVTDIAEACARYEVQS